MNCDNDKCKCPFVDGQAVYISVLDGGVQATFCTAECRKTADRDLFPDHFTGRFAVTEISIPGSHLRTVAKKTSPKGEAQVMIGVELPYNTSLDAINQYEGSCNLKLAREELIIIKAEKSKSKKEE